MTDEFTDLDRLRALRIDNEVSFTIPEGVDAGIAACVIEYGRMVVAIVPTPLDDALYVEIHQFVDGMSSGPAGRITISP